MDAVQLPPASLSPPSLLSHVIAIIAKSNSTTVTVTITALCHSPFPCTHLQIPAPMHLHPPISARTHLSPAPCNHLPAIGQTRILPGVLRALKLTLLLAFSTPQAASAASRPCSCPAPSYWSGTNPKQRPGQLLVPQPAPQQVVMKTGSPGG